MSPRAFVERRFVGSAAALVAGMLLSLSFAPFGWWPMAILMPAALIWLWEGATPRRAAVLGFWFNAGTFSVGTYWLYIAIKEIGHAPLVLALFLMVGFVAIMGAYHALLGWFVARYLRERGAMRWLVGIPGAWLFMEWWRSWFLTGFGWLALGYAHTDNWLGGLAPVIGQYGLGLLTLVLAGALVTLLLGDRRSRIVTGAAVRRRLGRGVRRCAASNGRSPTAGRSPSPWCRARFRRMRNGSTEQSRRPSSSCTRRARARRMAPTLIVWPESAIPDLANNHIEFYREVYQEASARGSSLMMGTLREEENPKTGEEEYFNSVLSMDKSTPGVGWYDKHHLVPFTEFVPVPGFVRQWLRAHEPAVLGLQPRRGAAGAARIGRAADLGQRLLRGRLRVDATARIAHRDVAGERHQRCVVRPFDGALPASADFAHARHGGRAADGAGGQRRRFGGHRRTAAKLSPVRRNMKRM